MNAALYALTLGSVALICAGQILFKLVGQQLNHGITWRAGGLMLLALSIYGIATLLWVYVLRTVPLTKAYPFMALSFVLVPLAGVYLFSEPVRPQYVVGVVLIVTGVLLTVRA